MSTPLRQLVLEDLEATLQQVTIANGYNVDVTTVSREKKTNVEVRPEDMPYVQIFKGSAPATHHTFGFSVRDMTINLLAFVTEPDAAEADWTVDMLRRDILDALTRDRQRGGAAIDTLLDDEFEGVHEEVETGQMRLQFRVRIAEHDDGRDAIDMAFGEYNATASAAMDWTTDDVFEKVTVPTSAGDLKDFTHADPGRLTYDGNLTRKFRVSYQCTLKAPTAAHTASLQIAKNGTAIAATNQKTYVDTNSGSIGVEAIVELASADYVELWGASDNAAVDSTFESIACVVSELTR